MPLDTRNLRSWIYLAIALTLAVVFSIDVLTPMRVAIWIFYVLPVVLCVWADRPSVPIVTAGASAALMIAGYALATGDPGTSSAVLQVNRVMGIEPLL